MRKMSKCLDISQGRNIVVQTCLSLKLLRLSLFLDRPKVGVQLLQLSLGIAQ